MKFLSVYSSSSALIDTKEAESSVSDVSYPYILTLNSIVNVETMLKVPLACVESISANQSICMAVTSAGKVFGWGEDDEGLLCNGIITTSTPIELKSLSSIIQISLSQDHAAALTSSGCLITWGSRCSGKLGDIQFDKNTPKAVPSAKAYEATSVITGSNYTGILTSGGYLMLYGQVSHNHLPSSQASHASPRKPQSKESLPYSNPSLDLTPVVQVAGSSHFILALLESQDLVVFDGCFNLTKLPVPEAGFEKILVAGGLAVGYSMTEVVVWQKVEQLSSKFECPVKFWTPSKSNVAEDFRVWTWGDGFVVASESFKPLEVDMDCSEFLVVPEKKLRKSIMESPLMPKGMVSPQSRKESLMRLFPGNEGEKIIAKIMKCQQEFSNKTLLQDTFKKFVHPLVKGVFFVIKEYARKKRIFNIMKNTAKVFCVCENLIYKRFLKRFFEWKRITAVGKVRKVLYSQFENCLSRRKPRKNFRKIRIFLKKIDFFMKKIENKMKIEIFKDFNEIFNREKALKFILKTLKNNLIINYYEKWRKVYMSKLIFVKSLEEKSFFCITSWLKQIFTILLKEYQRKEIYVIRSERGLSKLTILSSIFQKKSGMSKFKSVLMIAKANKLKKHVLLKRLCSTLFILFRTHLKSQVLHSFLSLKSLKKQSTLSTKQVSKISFKKNRVIKSQSSQKISLFPLLKLLHRHLRSSINHLLQISQDRIRSSFYNFLFTLNKILTSLKLKNKQKAMSSLKQSSGFCESFNEIFNSDSNTQVLLEEISNFKPCNSGSVNLSSFDNSPRIHESSPRSIDMSDGPTSFRTGELMKYQKYLINKKKLEMIKEDSFYESGKLFTVHKPKNKKSKSKNLKPPWKPSSISSNFSYQPKTHSAVEKGIKYYESRVQKTSKHLSVFSVSKLDDTAMRVFMKRKHSSKDSDGFEQKSSASPFLYSLDNGSPGLALEGLMDVGLAAFISSAILAKSRRNKLLRAFVRLKPVPIIQQVIPKPKPVEKAVPKTQTFSWQARMVHIGLEKLRFFVTSKKKASFLSFKKLVNKQ